MNLPQEKQPSTALVVYRPPSVLLPPASASPSVTSSIRFGAVAAVLAEHACAGPTAQLNALLARGDSSATKELRAHHNKVRKTLKRKLETAMKEAEQSLQAMTSMLSPVQERFSIGALRSVDRHGDALYIVDVWVQVSREDDEGEHFKNYNIRLALPSEEAFEMMQEDDTSFGDVGFVHIMDELVAIARHTHKLDPAVWSLSDNEIELGFFGAFPLFVDRKHMGDARKRARVNNKKPKYLRDSTVVDAVVFPANYFKNLGAKGTMPQVFSPHTVSHANVGSMMPPELEENPLFPEEDEEEEEEDEEDEEEEEE